MKPVEKDEMYFLTGCGALRIPGFLVPRGMHHAGDQIISLARFVAWLGEVAVREGVDVYFGVSAASLLWENGVVKGVKLADQGLDKERRPKENFLEGEKVLAGVTILADGARGVLSREYISKFGAAGNPQVYSIGVKQILRLPSKNNFGPGRAVHTLGFPNRPDVFGGSFFYSLGDDMVAMGLILGLDWRYTDLDPQKELELLKTHPFVAHLLKGAEAAEGGAKVIPEGGFFALPKLAAAGAILVGDAAGLVNMEKIKGIHYGIFSGMAAADAVVAGDLSRYDANLEARGVLCDMRHAKNFRAVFQAGLFIGAPLSMVQSCWPFRIGMPMDHARTQKGAYLKRGFKPVIDRERLAFLSGTMHREDEPSHLVIPDAVKCQLCEKEFQSPCTTFCPTEVYRRKGDAIQISATNCVHCGTCSVKCPFQNITWTPPEGGEGPRYKMM
jgi:electron-transferring-flavoprotein dehydrogenase